MGLFFRGISGGPIFVHQSNHPTKVARISSYDGGTDFQRNGGDLEIVAAHVQSLPQQISVANHAR
jgi:hypothetical protein